MRYSDAIDYLASLQMFGMRPGLENITLLADAFGNPQQRLRFIHVAGTNGKGSVCAMLEAIHRHAGRRVGLFTSPHLVTFTERIQVNRQLIPPHAVAHWCSELRRHIAVIGSEFTFFEAVTALALAYFAEQDCDLVIWETGLGGRLDATNLVTPLASVITNIDLDHQQWLGDTHDQIAAEKAGIIKPGRPVITGAAPGRGLEVIAATARRGGSPLTVVGSGPPPAHWAEITGSSAVWLDEDEAWRRAAGAAAGTFPEPALRGAHQRTNAAIALATAAELALELPVSIEALQLGLATVSWPGRMQQLSSPNGGTIVLDGAHNLAGAHALRKSFAASFPGRNPTLILGMLTDKDWNAVAQTLAPLASRILTVPVQSKRMLDPILLRDACASANPVVTAAACESLADALTQSAGDDFVLITGSLYLVGEAIEHLGAGSVPPDDERALNEWSTANRRGS